MKLLQYVPAPALLVGAGLFLFWLLSRWDGAQSARLTELDRQGATLTTQTLQAAKARRAVQATSDATDRENARLRAAVAQREASLARLRRLADSAGAVLVPVLAGLPDSVSHPIATLLALKDSVIATQDSVIHGLNGIIDNLTADRLRWIEQDRRDADLASLWKAQAGRWEKESKRGCLPIVGCVSRSAIALVAGGLGVAGGVILAR